LKSAYGILIRRVHPNWIQGMAKNGLPPVLTQRDLMSHGKSRVTVTCGELGVSEIIRFADFDYFGQHFRSDHFVIMLVTVGIVEVSINLRPLTIKENGLGVASPNAIKQVIRTSEDAQGIVVQFSMHFVNNAGLPKRSHELLNYFTSQYTPNWELDRPDAAAIERNMRDLFVRCEQSSRPFGKEQLNHMFIAFLYEIAAQGQKYSPPLIGQLTRKEELVIRFANLVSNNFRQERSVQFYADALNVTSKYLTETVKEINGKSAGKIIDDFVILESKLLLEKPENTIAQVADLLNFSDQSFFGKYFKRITGISPKEFKTTIYS
jgi:AraC family transcriptional regulator, transcriptional activator of pobA